MSDSKSISQNQNNLLGRQLLSKVRSVEGIVRNLLQKKIRIDLEIKKQKVHLRKLKSKVTKQKSVTKLKVNLEAFSSLSQVGQYFQEQEYQQYLQEEQLLEEVENALIRILGEIDDIERYPIP